MQANDELFPEPDTSISSSIFAVDNYELSKSYYKEVIYQTIKILMDEYGINIHRDLVFLLRQLTLSKIAYTRFVSGNLSKNCNLKIKFLPILDPYEALDMLIALPECPHYDSGIFQKITCDWEFRYGKKILPHIAKLSMAHQRSFIYQSQKIFKYLEKAYGEKYDLSKTFHTPDQIIEKLTQTENLNPQDDLPFEQQLEKVSKQEFYKKYFGILYSELMNKLSEEDQGRLLDLLSCLGRVNDFSFDQTLSGMNQTINQQIKAKFGEQHRTELIVKLKYLNDVIKPTNDTQAQGYQVASSFWVEFNIGEEGSK